MNRSSRPPILSWTLAILAVPVFYVLSFPPLSHFTDTVPPGGSDPYLTPIPPNWVTQYGKPYSWLCVHTPLQGPLMRYYNWWAYHR